MTAPATPAPADGAPGERVSDFPGVWTTHPMTREGAVKLMGQFWHAVEGATIHHLPGEQPTAEEIAKSEEAGRIAKEIERHVIAMLSMPFATAAPLPAPSASAGVGAKRAVLNAATRYGDLRVEYEDAEGSPKSVVVGKQIDAVWAELTAAIDALSTAAAPVRPDREAVEDRETLIVETIDAELVALQRHAGDVANSSEGGASETDWANGVDYAARAIRQALDLATIRPAAPESEAQS